MKNEKKQLRELSDEDLKNVTGGYLVYPDGPNVTVEKTCPTGWALSTNKNGEPICVLVEA